MAARHICFFKKSLIGTNSPSFAMTSDVSRRADSHGRTMRVKSLQLRSSDGGGLAVEKRMSYATLCPGWLELRGEKPRPYGRVPDEASRWSSEKDWGGKDLRYFPRP